MSDPNLPEGVTAEDIDRIGESGGFDDLEWADLNRKTNSGYCPHCENEEAEAYLKDCKVPVKFCEENCKKEYAKNG